MKENENPSAFPSPPIEGTTDERQFQRDGMTLRDYAAIRFIAAQISKTNPFTMTDSNIIKIGLSLADDYLSQRAEPDLLCDECKIPNGSCLICGNFRPFEVWSGTVGVCHECREAASRPALPVTPAQKE